MFQSKRSDFDKNAIGEILLKLKEKLDRELTDDEIKVFSMKRSGIAYEMILDYISAIEKSKDDIEK